MVERSVDQARAVFIEGMGAAAATSGVLSQLQGRIFAVLFLEDHPLSLDDITKALQLSKSNISINIRGLVEWHLVRRVSVPNSRRDHYEAASDFWRVMKEIMERRFRRATRPRERPGPVGQAPAQSSGSVRSSRGGSWPCDRSPPPSTTASRHSGEASRSRRTRCR
jgi:hypothetical protein